MFWKLNVPCHKETCNSMKIDARFHVRAGEPEEIIVKFIKHGQPKPVAWLDKDYKKEKMLYQ